MLEPARLEKAVRQAGKELGGSVDSLIGILRHGGLSLDLIHHSMHVLGSRLLGFTQELFDDSGSGGEADEEMEAMLLAMADVFPNMVAMMQHISHDEDSILGQAGCDDQVEFLFTIDLMLDGVDRFHLAETETSAGPPPQDGLQNRP